MEEEGLSVVLICLGKYIGSYNVLHFSKQIYLMLSLLTALFGLMKATEY